MNKDCMVNLGDYLQSNTNFEALVVYFDCPHGYDAEYPFGDGEELLFLNSIKCMPGHGVFVNSVGTVYWGHHTNNFYMEYEEAFNE